MAYRKNTYLYCLIYLILFLTGCKTDEFKFNELTVKDDFRIKLKSPLYSGTDKNGDILEFADFIHDWKKNIVNRTPPFTVLEYNNRQPRSIPTKLIFSPSVIIDSLAFLIDGEYEMDSIELVFNVTNSCPFPLNTEIRFIQNGVAGPAILPPSFDGADFAVSPIQPVATIHRVLLDSLQSKSLLESKRLKLTAWYNQTDFINENDTLSAHYPIDYSIVLIGQVKAKND